MLIQARSHSCLVVYLARVCRVRTARILLLLSTRQPVVATPHSIIPDNIDRDVHSGQHELWPDYCGPRPLPPWSLGTLFAAETNRQVHVTLQYNRRSSQLDDTPSVISPMRPFDATIKVTFLSYARLLLPCCALHCYRPSQFHPSPCCLLP